jgi:hypothetical protein
MHCVIASGMAYENKTLRRQQGGTQRLGVQACMPAQTSHALVGASKTGMTASGSSYQYSQRKRWAMFLAALGDACEKHAAMRRGYRG